MIKDNTSVDKKVNEIISKKCPHLSTKEKQTAKNQLNDFLEIATSIILSNIKDK